MWMHELDDIALLREYIERDSEEAFATLVTRHIDRVYSVALRHAGNPHQAEEITQAVFVILARKSRHLSKHVILEGWLYQTARLTAMTFIRGEIRRARREQEAHMQTVLNENDSAVWTQIAPLLDAAMAALNETDRHAVVLRFFYGKSMREIGATTGDSEDTARMRINRAMEKLRKFFLKRGVTSKTATLAGVISASSVQAAPVSLAKSVTAAAIAKGATASTSTLTVIKEALKIMAWTKAKTAIAVSVATILVVGTTTTLMVRLNHHADAQTIFPRSSWANAGYADPASALETVLWAGNQADGKTLVASMTPDLQQQLQQRFGGELQKRGMSLEEFFTQSAKGHVGAITGFRVLNQEVVADNQIILHLYVQGKEREDTFKMRKIGNEWKLDQFPPDY